MLSRVLSWIPRWVAQPLLPGMRLLSAAPVARTCNIAAIRGIITTGDGHAAMLGTCLEADAAAIP